MSVATWVEVAGAEVVAMEAALLAMARQALAAGGVAEEVAMSVANWVEVASREVGARAAAAKAAEVPAVASKVAV
eukprot:113872-Prymnesium_polylepis.1